MMARTLQAIREVLPTPFTADVEAVNCHHNYISREHHYGKDVWVTRKGAKRSAWDYSGQHGGEILHRARVG